jgi:hypothetical protein
MLVSVLVALATGAIGMIVFTAKHAPEFWFNLYGLFNALAWALVVVVALAVALFV